MLYTITTAPYNGIISIQTIRGGCDSLKNGCWYKLATLFPKSLFHQVRRVSHSKLYQYYIYIYIYIANSPICYVTRFSFHIYLFSCINLPGSFFSSLGFCREKANYNGFFLSCFHFQWVLGSLISRSLC